MTQNLNGVNTTIYDNGLTIVRFHTKNKNLFRIELVVRAGMLLEKNSEDGYAHILEHLLAFFTSNNYPDAKENENYFTEKGIKRNAWTSERDCGYYLQGLKEDFHKALDMIIQSYVNTKIDESIFNQERGAVIQELSTYLADGYRNLDRYIEKQIFNKTNLGNPVEDELANVRKAKLINVMNFRKRYYKPKYTTLFIVSSEFDEKTEELLNNIINIKETCNPIYHEGKNNIKLKRIIDKTNATFIYCPVNQTRIDIYFTFPFTLEYQHKANALSYILSGGLGSLLYNRLRRDLGYVYNVSSDTHIDPLNKNFNYFCITTKCDINNTVKIINEILNIFKHMNIDNKILEPYINQQKIDNFENDEFDSFTKCFNFFKRKILFNIKPIRTLNEEAIRSISITADDIKKMKSKMELIGVFCGGKFNNIKNY